MKKKTSLLLALSLALSLTACGSPAEKESKNPETSAPVQSQAVADSELDAVKANGSLKIGFTYFEPMNYLDDNGEFVGFETEFATAVCEKLGVEPESV